MPMPTVGGHEAAGVVVEVGPEVALTRVGARVVLSAIPTCGHCRWCNEGKSYLCDVNAVQMRGRLPTGATAPTSTVAGVTAMGQTGAFSQYVTVR
jgi:S-(hydroxymethyl)glutathione dehydrogenase/alcohol dehydrogenase